MFTYASADKAVVNIVRCRMQAAIPSIKNILFDAEAVLINHPCVLLCDSDHAEDCAVLGSGHSLAAPVLELLQTWPSCMGTTRDVKVLLVLA